MNQDGIGDPMKVFTSSRPAWTGMIRRAGFSVTAMALGVTAALAQTVVVQGNRRVDAETVRSYLTDTSPSGLETARREMLGSGLFSDVRISRRGSQVIVSVSENDTINRVAFEGNSKLKGDFLVNEVQSRARGPYSAATVAADIEKIKELYKRGGYGLANVTARQAPLPNGRFDLVFTINEGGKTGIQSINFTGNRVYSNYRLKGLMNSTEYNWLSWLKTSDVYDPDRIAADLELVRRFYLKNGYADFRIVSSDARFDAAAGGWIVDIAIEEGERYTIANSRVESRLRDIDPTALERVVTTSPGATYNAESVERSIQNITTEVMRRGYAFAQVRPAGVRDASGRTIGVTYVVDEGARVYVERINVRGNTRTRDYVIRREFDLGEGDPYNKVLIDRAERRLNNLGYFNKVRITNEPGSAPDRVVVNIDVEDKATGSFSIAGGYSTADGIIGDVSLSESNFLGRGQFVKIAGQLGQRTRGVDFSFTEPFFLGQRIAAGFDIFSKFTDASKTSRSETRVTGGQLRLTLPITEEFSITPRYSLYQTEVKIPNTGDKPYNDCTNPLLGVTPLNPNGTPLYPDCVYNGEASVAVKEAAGKTITSLAGINLTYNALDSVVNPRNGLFAELKPEVAGLGGDSKFLRVAGDMRYYKEVFDDVVTLFRVQGGHISNIGGGNVRLVDHYFLGPSLVRGFSSSGIGPRDVLSDPSSNALGGSTYFGGTVELQFPIFGLPRELGLRGAVFADAGTLFDYKGATRFDLNRNGVFDCAATNVQPECVVVRDRNVIRSSVGVSLLWQSPLGPIRFDYAFALSRDKGGLTYNPYTNSSVYSPGDRLQAFRFSGGTRF
jgi:outer membrane protein insertion porin family